MCETCSVEETDRLSLDHLPRDELVQILKHLDPVDIVHLAQTCLEVHRLLQVGVVVFDYYLYKSPTCRGIRITDPSIVLKSNITILVQMHFRMMKYGIVSVTLFGPNKLIF